MLLAGMLDEPLPLLQALAKPNGDGIARRRLALAGVALGEVAGERFQDDAALCRMRDEITTQAIDWWREPRPNGTEALSGYVARSLPTLARRTGRYEGKTLLDWIATGLAEDTADRNEGWDLPGHVRIATPPILEMLAERLRDPDVEVRASATPVTVEALAAMLRDPEWWVSCPAVRAIGELGAAAATPPLLEALAERLRVPRMMVRRSAAGAVAKQGAAETPPIMAVLAERLRDPVQSHPGSQLAIGACE